MNREAYAVIEKCNLSIEHLMDYYKLESHPAQRKIQVISLATSLINNTNLNVENLPQNDKNCAKHMISKGLLKPENKLELVIKNKKFRANKNRNKQIKEIIKAGGVGKEVIQDIVKKTAIATLTLVEEFAPILKKHFAYSKEEKCLKLKNIPNIQESREIMISSVELIHGSTLAKSEAHWMLGNVIDEILRTHGKKVKIKEIANKLGKSENGMRICLGVYRAFKGCRVHGLSFSHHREVMYCHGMSPEMKMDMLFNARQYGLSVFELRRLCAYMRSKLELEMKMPEKVLKKHLEDVLSKTMSDHVTCYVLINLTTGYSRYLRGVMTDEMISKFDFILQVKPEIHQIKGSIGK